MFFYLIIFALCLYLLYSYRAQPTAIKQEKFTQSQTQIEENDKKFRKYYGQQQMEFPCYKKMSQLGYDNPYIYPYNYAIKPIENIGYYKYPQWARYIESVKLEQTFPGFTL